MPPSTLPCYYGELLCISPMASVRSDDVIGIFSVISCNSMPFPMFDTKGMGKQKK